MCFERASALPIPDLSVFDGQRTRSIIVSVDGVNVEAGKAAELSRETCGLVEASAHQGGLVARGVSYKK